MASSTVFPLAILEDVVQLRKHLSQLYLSLFLPTPTPGEAVHLSLTVALACGRLAAEAGRDKSAFLSPASCMAHRHPAQRSVGILLDLVRTAGYEEPSGFLEKGASACSEALEAALSRNPR